MYIFSWSAVVLLYALVIVFVGVTSVGMLLFNCAEYDKKDVIFVICSPSSSSSFSSTSLISSSLHNVAMESSSSSSSDWFDISLSASYDEYIPQFLASVVEVG